MGFTDLVSSGRGPGVIGTLIAVFVLVAFGSLYTLVFDPNNLENHKKIEAVVRDLALEIDGKKTQIESYKKETKLVAERKAQESELRELTAKVEATAKRIEEATAEQAGAGEAVKVAKNEWEDYKENYRSSTWAKAKGRDLGTLKLSDGTVFENTTIRKIDHAGMDIMCSSGPKNIKFELLPTDLQDEFQFDTVKRDDFVAGQNAAEANHVESVQYAQTRERRDGKILARAEAKKKKEDSDTAWKQAKADVERFRNLIARKKSDISAEKRKNLSKAPQMEIELRRLQAQADQNSRSIGDLDRARRDADALTRTLEREIETLNDELARMQKEYADKKAAEAAAAGGGAAQ
jgi:DNA repair exonuclease SbcCD ATPase subunit